MFEWPWNRGILSYKEVQKLRGTIPVEEYNALVLKSLERRDLLDFAKIPFWRLERWIENLKFFCRNAWYFRKFLCRYGGWDFGYDLEYLERSYAAKIRSFTNALEYIEGADKLLAEIKIIHAEITELLEMDGWEDDYTKKYAALHKKLGKSWKYWW